MAVVWVDRSDGERDRWSGVDLQVRVTSDRRLLIYNVWGVLVKTYQEPDWQRYEQFA